MKRLLTRLLPVFVLFVAVLVGHGGTSTRADTLDEFPTPTGTPTSAPVTTSRVAYVSNFASSYVSAVDVDTNTLITTIPVGGGQAGLALSPDRATVYVAGYGTNSNAGIDTASHQVGTTISSVSSPLGVNLQPA